MGAVCEDKDLFLQAEVMFDLHVKSTVDDNDAR